MKTLVISLACTLGILAGLVLRYWMDGQPDDFSRRQKHEAYVQQLAAESVG